VAEQIVKRATKSLGDFPPVLAALGLFDTQDPDQMNRNMAALKTKGPEAAEQRLALRRAIEASDYVYNTHGVEMNQRYASRALVPDGSPEPPFERDAELYHQASTRPGAPVPHVWLDRDRQRVSTVDLCGQGRWTLLTSMGAHEWEQAALQAAQEAGIELVCHVVGPVGTVQDPFGEFARIREVSETGALLVRPDRIVAWRTASWTPESAAALQNALRQILHGEVSTTVARAESAETLVPA